MVALGLHCCAQAFSSCGERGLFSNWSASASHCPGFPQQGVGSRLLGISSCGTWTELPLSRWGLPGPGIQPMSPALAGGFLTPDHQGNLGSSFLIRCSSFPSLPPLSCLPSPHFPAPLSFHHIFSLLLCGPFLCSSQGLHTFFLPK